MLIWGYTITCRVPRVPLKGSIRGSIVGFYNIGAEIVTDTIVGVPYYDYSIINGPQNPILSIKAPILQDTGSSQTASPV